MTTNSKFTANDYSRGRAFGRHKDEDYDVVIAATNWLRTRANAAAAAWTGWQRQAKTRRAVAHLDHRMLADIGIDAHALDLTGTATRPANDNADRDVA